jgi:hypothetical protein
MESIETACYALVSCFSLLDCIAQKGQDLGNLRKRWAELRDLYKNDISVRGDAMLIPRFNLVNHNNHGVDVSKYEK